MRRALKQSTAANLTVFMTSSTDHVAGATGLTLTLTASKDGAAFASISPTVTELANGWYAIALTATHTNTLGDLALHITATGADPTDLCCHVVAYDFTDAVRLGLSALPTAAAGANAGLPVVGSQIPNANAAASGGLPTVGTGAGQINPDGSGNVPVAMGETLPVSPTAGTLGEALKFADTRLDAAITSRMATFTLPANFSSLVIDANGRVDLSKWIGAAVNALVSGRVDAQVGAYAAGQDPGTLVGAHSTGDTYTYDQAMRLMMAALLGVLAGAGTTTVTIKQADNAAGTTRITATVDASGDRTAVTLAP